MSASRLQIVAEFLKSQSTLALSTSNADREPAVAPLFYLPGEHLELYWFSSPSSRHSRNLRRDPAAAITIFRPTANWREIRGVQMRGAVEVVAERSTRERVAAAYAERFQLGLMFEAAISRSRLYVFRPRWVRYIDNSKRFGYKFELDIEPPT